jgi:predicted metalloprotease
VAWDSGKLLPELRQRFGDAAVVVVIAHEIGHAVHHRLGLGDAMAREPQRWPTILVEAAADCFAGAAIRDIRDGNAPGVSIDRRQLDDAMRALITFRDPVGTAATEAGAHGNAFDRVSAFQDGYRRGGRTCAEMTIDNRTFTARKFGSAADAARDGNLPMPELLASVGADARAWFGALAASGGRAWQAPEPTTDPAAPPCPAGGDQGPVQYCPSDGRIVVNVAALTTVVNSIGDYAGGVLLASRYGLAAGAALKQPVTGPAAGRRALCLTGAYTGGLLTGSGRGYQLSPGDLDEAVHTMLALDFAQRDASGVVGGDEAGFERVEIFRAGTLGGPPACA